MNIVNWKDEIYSVKVPHIDKQHQKLFDILNHLFISMSRGESRDVIRNILNELVDYSQYHFNSEEQYFCPLKGYKNKEKHIKEHQEFILEMQKFQYDFINHKKMLTMDIFIYIRDWINNHIKKCDKGFCCVD